MSPYELRTSSVDTLCVILIKSSQGCFLAASQRKKRHNRWFTTKADTVLRTFGFLVMQASSNQLIEVHSIRHLVNWLHVMFLLITTGYNSGLASIFTVPP